MYTLKVNQRAHEEKQRKELEKQARELEEKILALTGPTKPRRPKGLKFHEPGVFQAQAEELKREAAKQEKEAKIKALKEKLDKISKQKGINQSTISANLTKEDIPDVEWWDKWLIKNRTLDEVKILLDNPGCNVEEILSGITNLIERPALKPAPCGQPDDVQVPIFLTKAEHKKLRKQKRREEEAKKQYEIRIGVRPKPEPKLKASNVMYTLAGEVIANPTMIDQMVKGQEQERQQAHEELNETRKLKAQEERAKRSEKVKQDLDVNGVWHTVFRVTDLSSNSHKFKVIKNARQLSMGGILVLNKDFNLVVIEGGPRQQRKYKHLMLDRIDWSSEEKPDNSCTVVWEGQVDKRQFPGFKKKEFTNVTEAKNFLKSINLENYCNYALNLSSTNPEEDLDNLPD